MRCTICREKISRNAFREWRQNHYLSVHPEYAKWMGRWMRNFLAIVSVFVVAIIVTEYLWLSSGGWYGVVAGIVILSFIGFCVYDVDLLRRTRGRFVREWRETHPPGSE
ncbi:MAG TPA: hypothetical protein VNA15_04295 [Candidatus Angelobacter sp.]|nr:hypothetical protein [Candidatus Angelobacter sp.]